jgi:ABC-type transport system involved in multi-copper enzyme maturation permease subunit
MNAVWIIAGLTIKEAVRRRVFVASLCVALLFVVCAFLPLHFRRHITPDMTPAEVAEQLDRAAKIFAWLGCGMIKFFSSILAVTLAAGAISAEVERGVLSVVVPKPMPRAAIYLGKWLGLLTLVLSSVALWSVLLALSIHHQTGFFHPRMFLGVLATCQFPVLFVTLTLFFSSYCTYALSAGLSLIAAGVALAEDLLIALGRIVFDSSVLVSLGNVVGYIVPLGKMNHWITKGLGDAGTDLSALSSPFGLAAAATTTADLVYVISYIVAALILGLIVFQRRDL